MSLWFITANEPPRPGSQALQRAPANIETPISSVNERVNLRPVPFEAQDAAPLIWRMLSWIRGAYLNWRLKEMHWENYRLREDNRALRRAIGSLEVECGFWQGLYSRLLVRYHQDKRDDAPAGPAFETLHFAEEVRQQKVKQRKGWWQR